MEKRESIKTLILTLWKREDEAPKRSEDVYKRQVFVMGDNRNASLDSRSSYVGCIDERDILGKVLLCFLPFSDFGDVYKRQLLHMPPAKSANAAGSIPQTSAPTPHIPPSAHAAQAWWKHKPS